MSVPNVAFGAGGGAQAGVEAAAGEVCSEATSGWTTEDKDRQGS